MLYFAFDALVSNLIYNIAFSIYLINYDYLFCQHCYGMLHVFLRGDVKKKKKKRHGSVVPLCLSETEQFAWYIVHT